PDICHPEAPEGSIIIPYNFQRLRLPLRIPVAAAIPQEVPGPSALSVSDACRPSPWSDAPSTRRAVFESFDFAQDRLHELARSPCFAAVQSNETGRGIHGFGYFCRNKSGSAAGRTPATIMNTKNPSKWILREIIGVLNNKNFQGHIDPQERFISAAAGRFKKACPEILWFRSSIV
ncbi:MAG: hypothetical protein KC587_19400, partial [Nitrospira sp.]|nr:hypothetical protein [Nitrospira sp.]